MVTSATASAAAVVVVEVVAVAVMTTVKRIMKFLMMVKILKKPVTMTMVIMLTISSSLS